MTGAGCGTTAGFAESTGGAVRVVEGGGAAASLAESALGLAPVILALGGALAVIPFWVAESFAAATAAALSAAARKATLSTVGTTGTSIARSSRGTSEKSISFTSAAPTGPNCMY